MRFLTGVAVFQKKLSFTCCPPERAGTLIDDRRRVFFFCRTHCSTLALGLMCCFHAASPASHLCPAPDQARSWVLARPDWLRRASVLRPLGSWSYRPGWLIDCSIGLHCRY